MGTFRVTVELGDPAGTRFESFEALVDAGASYTWVPVSLLARLGVAPTRRFPFTFADGRRVERDMGETKIRIGALEQTTWVVFGDDGTQPLLGAYSLEGFSLAVDPVNRRLVPMTGWLAVTSWLDRGRSRPR